MRSRPTNKKERRVILLGCEITRAPLHTLYMYTAFAMLLRMIGKGREGKRGGGGATRPARMRHDSSTCCDPDGRPASYHPGDVVNPVLLLYHTSYKSPEM